MNQHQLRATAALWSLRAALAALDARTEEDDHAIRAEQQAAAEPLKSPSYGTRQGRGGHGDPTADAAGTIETIRPNRWAPLRAEVGSQLREVAEHLPGFAGPLDRLCGAVPHMSDRMADATRLLADRVDARIRRLIRLPSDRQLVPRVPCPGCDTTGLMMRLSPPASERVIECGTCGRAWPRGNVVRSVST